MGKRKKGGLFSLRRKRKGCVEGDPGAASRVAEEDALRLADAKAGENGVFEEGDEEVRKHKEKLEKLKKEETEAAEQQKACEDCINEIIRSRQDESSKQLEKLQSLENTVPHTFTDNL